MNQTHKERIIIGLFLLVSLLISNLFLPTSIPFFNNLYLGSTSDPSLDEKIELILGMPRGQKIPRSEFDKYIPRLLKFSRETNSLLISSGCQVYPFVFRVMTDSYFTLTNLDTKEHVVIINQEHSYRLSPKQSVRAKADLSGTGLHGIFCDQIQNGILFSTTCYKEVSNDPSDIMKNCQW